MSTGWSPSPSGLRAQASLAQAQKLCLGPWLQPGLGYLLPAEDAPGSFPREERETGHSMKEAQGKDPGRIHISVQAPLAFHMSPTPSLVPACPRGTEGKGGVGHLASPLASSAPGHPPAGGPVSNGATETCQPMLVLGTHWGLPISLPGPERMGWVQQHRHSITLQTQLLCI